MPKRSFVRTIVYFFVSLLVVGSVFVLGVVVGRGNLHFGKEFNTSEANKSLPADLRYSDVEEVYDLLKADFDGSIDQSKLLDGLKKGLVSAAGDPYTEYFSPKEAKSFDDALAGSFTGIGAELGTNDQNQIVIVSPLNGFPAQKAGLKPKDVIAAVDGRSTSGMAVDAVVGKIRGDAGAKVTLTIVRDGGQPFDVTITRAKINLPSVEYKIVDGIGYMKINQFNSDTAALARRGAESFINSNVKGIVLDLRGNPGGYLSGAVDVSSLWLKERTEVVSQRRGGIVIETQYTKGTSPLAGIPTVVLIDSGSASASEITAGALHDHKTAKLVGIKSFGKGSVQQVAQLSGGGELKVTVARWYTPAGKNIDKQGISPDIEVKLTEAQAKTGQDPQLDKAYELLR